MELQVLAFGIAKDIFGAQTVNADLMEGAQVTDLKQQLEERYPRLKQLASYMIALNNEYANGEEALNERDEIAIIPPVSGG
jgi:molybdopterin synthase sulfur carrier subunit